MNNDQDDITKFEDSENAKKLPICWIVLSVVLLVTAIVYFIAYMPGVSNWDQVKAYEETVTK